MIGALDTARALARYAAGEAADAVLARLGRPDPQAPHLAAQLDQLAAECDALRAERDQARAALADAQLAARQAERRADGRQAAVDRLTAERDAARASLQNLGGLLSGIARRMTDEEAELALVEMAEAGARLARGEAAAKALVELRDAASKAIARTQLFTEGKCSEEDAKAATLALINLCLPPEAPHG